MTLPTSQTVTKTTAAKKRIPTWLSAMPGVPAFAAIPPQLLVHPGIKNADVKVFAVLALHASFSGTCVVGRERLAELLGFTEKGEPNVGSISRYLGPKGSLVKLGFVKNLGQVGYNRANKYQLCTPDTSSSARIKSRKKSNSDYRAISPEVLSSNEEVFYLDDELFFPKNCFSDIESFHEGSELEIPAVVYAHFKIKRPTSRHSSEL